MRRARVWIVGACLLSGLVAWVWLHERPPEVDERGPLVLPSLGAELFYRDASDIVQRGSARVLVLRFVRPVELVPHHFRSEGLPGPQTVEQWAEHLAAPVVFNAGQFDEKLDYLGWLKRDGEWLSPVLKPHWKALLVSGPLDGAAWARIVDLDHANKSVAERYRHVIQSMMLLDSEHKLRVRDTDITACRTVVAEDMRGRLLILFTEGATTLGDLARWLAKADLGIVRAMNLDGGIESQLAVRTPELQLTHYGQYGTGTTAWSGGPGEIRYPLPAIIAVRTLTAVSSHTEP